MNFWDNIKQTFRNGGILTQLIYINVGIFLLLKILLIVCKLFNIAGVNILPYIAVSADFSTLLYRPWTLLSYMFVHEGFLHIFFNLLCLYWFGKMFLMFFSEKQLLGVYITGGLLGAAFYILSFNIFPYYSATISNSLMIGASGSIMALIVATAVKSPNSQMQLLFIGAVKLKYIALATILISFLGITSENSGGELAHLGGALGGYLFASLFAQGKDITLWISKIMDRMVSLFRLRQRMKVNKTKNTTGKRRMTDAEYNQNKVQRMAEIDRILDKIKSSGYESLSADEKKKLFEQGK